MVSATQNSVNATFTYDADGIRSSRTVNSVTTNFVTDKNRDYAQVVAEVENGATKATYTYGADLISQNRSGAASYYLYDALGSVKALSDSTGTVTDTYNYTAFGKELGHTGSTENAYKYAGEQFDSALDNYYLRARYYNQNVGRFTQMDSYQGNGSDPITLHKYLYANVNPISVRDPSGRFGLAEIGATLNVLSSSIVLVATGMNYYTITSILTKGAESGVQGKTLEQAMVETADNSSAQKYIGPSVSNFQRGVIGREPIVEGGHGLKRAHFTSAVDFIDRDIQYIQVSWYLQTTLFKGVDILAFYGWVDAVPYLGALSRDDIKDILAYYSQDNLAANFRGLQLGSEAKSSGLSFKDWAQQRCQQSPFTGCKK
jgi:RHS repeat-associated protein